jgi:glycosyltransferase involved in cell wall biosynthesis
MTVPPRLPHAVQISFFSDPEERSPARLLDAWPTLVDVAEAACRSGIRVSVVQASSHRERLARGDVRYYFLPFGRGQRAVAENAALGELLRSLGPDVFHVHGLGFPRDVLSLASLASGTPIILQDHANRPPRIWQRTLWRRQMSIAAGITFCALEQAQPFADAGLVRPETQLYAIPESTSRFAPGDRQEARRITGLRGDPAVLWVGHLDANKDPLTVLDGISAAARELPGLQLFCCFGAAPLLRDVQDRIATDSNLRPRVRLLGRVPHARIEQLMRAADLFVLGSHREGSGYSLIEALACGLPPVVTDIPSFRSLTRAGAVGMLWPCDDPRALCDAVRSIAARVDSEMRAAVRAHFDLELSSNALGLKLAAMYENVLGRERAAEGAARRSEGNRAVRSSCGEQ